MPSTDALSPRAWSVSALCRAVAEALDLRFNPVTVKGEVSGFSRAASGHCYFSIKDDAGQIRCAMFRRAASLVDFTPRDGELVEIRGRLGVYEARGDLQMVVESMSRAGQGALFEQFMRLKAKLDAEGLFDPALKRDLPSRPRAIGVVTSLGAAAWHDVMTALQRRVPHIPVVVAPASVQGAGAPGELVKALSNLYLLTQEGRGLEADLALGLSACLWPRACAAAFAGAAGFGSCAGAGASGNTPLMTGVCLFVGSCERRVTAVGSSNSSAIL